jgi:hypothetical protein
MISGSAIPEFIAAPAIDGDLIGPEPLFEVSDPASGLEVRLKKPRLAIHVHRNMYRV